MADEKAILIEDETIFCPECNAILVNGICPNGCTLIEILEGN